MTKRQDSMALLIRSLLTTITKSETNSLVSCIKSWVVMKLKNFCVTQASLSQTQSDCTAVDILLSTGSMSKSDGFSGAQPVISSSRKNTDAGVSSSYSRHTVWVSEGGSGEWSTFSSLSARLCPKDMWNLSLESTCYWQINDFSLLHFLLSYILLIIHALWKSAQNRFWDLRICLCFVVIIQRIKDSPQLKTNISAPADWLLYFVINIHPPEWAAVKNKMGKCFQVSDWVIYLHHKVIF